MEVKSTQCYEGYDLVGWHCIKQDAPEGQYYNPYFQAFKPCSDSECTKCHWEQSYGQDICDECSDDFLLEDHMCVRDRSCSPGQYYNFIYKECKTCDEGCKSCFMNTTEALENPDIWILSIDWEFCNVYYYDFAILFAELYSQYVDQEQIQAFEDHDYSYYEYWASGETTTVYYDYNSYAYFTNFIYHDTSADDSVEASDDTTWLYWQYIYYTESENVESTSGLDQIQVELQFGQSCRSQNSYYRGGRYLRASPAGTEKKALKADQSLKKEQLSQIFK